MNHSQLALLLVRLTSFQFVFYGLNYLTYLPERLAMQGSARSIDLAQMEIKMLIARAILHITVGAALWFFSQSVIQFFSAHSESNGADDSPLIS